MTRFYKLLLIIMPFSMLVAGSGFGGYRLMHVKEARTFQQGRLEIFTDLNFYTAKRDAQPGVAATNLWLNQGNLAFTYGFWRYFEFSTNITIYQDTHSDENNLPSDITAGLKFGNFEIGTGQFRTGLNVDLNFGVGKYFDVPFETYNPGGFQLGLQGLFSYYNDPYLPERSLSVHTNFGYWAFNEAGAEIRGSQTIPGAGEPYLATENSSAFTYGLGIKYPFDVFDLYLEMHGLVFATQPDSFALGRENYAYVTPGFKYTPIDWLRLSLGVDVLVVGDAEETFPADDKGLISNYASWKMHIGADIKILPITRGASAAEIERQQFNDRIDFFESVIEERQKTESIEDELDKLRRQREAAEQELEELRQLLEEEEKQKK
jgi:hypothetical protein